MSKAGRVACLFFLLLLVASCLVMVQSGYAQSIPKPSVPEFTLKYAVHSIDVPGATPTYTIDPYNGQQKIQDPGSSGYHLDRRVVEIEIKNQPFTRYNDANNNYEISLYYNVSYKGAYETEWKYFYYDQQPGGGFWQSSTDYTVINFTEVPNDGGTIEFRVQAQAGYYTEYYMPFVAYSFHGEVSGWSNTQSVDVPGASQSSIPTSMPYPAVTSNTPASPENQTTWLLIGAVVGLGAAVAALAIAVTFMYNKIKRMEPKQNGA
jgi:hypothetical protein